jgi:capsular exopolysaccharide synthesis family protein
MRLGSLRTTGKLRTVLITSALPQDGKTTTALNLATALTEQRAKKVLLIDADLHRGTVEQQLGLARDIGLVECLHDAVKPYESIRRVEPLGWYLLSRGKTDVSNPSELLQPQEFSALLHAFRPQFDWILVDSPPVLSLSDSVSLSQAVDGTLLVVRAGSTPTKAVEDAVSILGQNRLVGVVLNGIGKQHQPYGKYSFYYHPPVSDK